MTSSSQLIESVANTTSHRDRDDLDCAIARLLVQFLEAASVAIYRLHEDAGTTRVARRLGMTPSRGEPEQRDPEDDLSQLPALDEVPAWRECVERRERVQYDDASGHSRNAFAIEGERGVIGILEIETSAPLMPRDASLVSGILRIMKNHVALLDYGERDTLTGLYNRKLFEASFEKLRGRMRRLGADETTRNDAMVERRAPAQPATHEPSWFGVADIDKFKSINDTYGHLFGDEVLLLVAQLMKKSFRGGDLLFRFGGEEFVIILERASSAGAEIAFERLRAEIEAFKFPQVGSVTISLGYTRIDVQDASATCVERADAALYYGKHHGRNQVRSYEALIAGGGLKAKPAGDDIELF